MNSPSDPFTCVVEGEEDTIPLRERALLVGPSLPAAGWTSSGATARLQGFDADDRPLVTGLLEVPGELVVARSTVVLARNQIGSTVVVLFDRGNVRHPIIVGVLCESLEASHCDPARTIEVHADRDRLVLSAEREILLRCGDASITLTRAGKILIKGAYILSRSRGYNRIKGAAVDIN